MADKTETITAHVMALTTQKLGKFFSFDDPGDMKTLERWHMRLSNLPDDPAYIDKLFEPFYAHKQMPNPDDLMKEHWRTHNPAMLSEAEAGSMKALTWKDVKRAAKTDYSKKVLELLRRLFGVPVDPSKIKLNRSPKDKDPRFITRPHKDAFKNKEEFMDELRKLGKEYNIPWEL